MAQHDPIADLEPRLKAILAQEYPRFSDAEYAHRRKLLGEAMDKAGVDHLLVVTSNRSGNATQWLTSWPGTVEAWTVFKPGEKMALFMEWHNHVPLATKIARELYAWLTVLGLLLVVGVPTGDGLCSHEYEEEGRERDRETVVAHAASSLADEAARCI